MIITEIKRDKGHTVRVTLDSGEQALIELDFAAEIPLKKGQELSHERLRELLAESDYRRAKQRALWYLDRAEHSERALYEKLVRARFSKSVSARVIARLKELGLIDDERYAHRLAERMAENNISKREAAHKLFARGIPKEIINSALEDTPCDECAQIRAIIEKKYRLKLENPQNTQKVYAALIRKGFSYRAVRDTLKQYSEEIKYSDEDF